MPQPAHKPTAETRKLVHTLAGYGVTHEDIAATLEISQPTLRKYYSEDMAKGDAIAKGKIGEKVYEKAMAGDTTMLIFLAKVRLGFKETVRNELTGVNGGPIRTINGEMSPKEAAEAYAETLKGNGEGPGGGG